MKSPSKRTMRLMAFGPALVMVCVTAYVASGVSVVSSATGAATVGVNGTVASSFSTTPGTTGGGGATGCADETVGSFASAFQQSNGCTITFSSNNGTGSQVVFENDNAGAVDFFCGDPTGAAPRDCTNNSLTVDDLSGAGNTLAAEGFGLALVSVGGDGGGTAGAGVSGVDGTPVSQTSGESIWSGIPDQGSAVELCDFPGPHSTNTTCNFVFGALGKGGTQGEGAYTGTLRLTAALT